MEEENLQNSTEETGFSPEPPEELSSTDAMVGVITQPGDTYSSIGQGSVKKYWLMPVLVFIIINLISTFIIFSDPEILSKKMDDQLEQTKEKLDESVKKGDMSKEEADQSLEMTKKFMNPESPVTQGIGYLFSVIGPFFVLFLLSLIYFIGLKIFKSGAGYSDMLNVVGLAFIISAIQQLITAVLSILMGEVSTLSLGLILSADTVGNGLNSFLNALDVFSIWFYIVISIGLTRIGKISSGQAAR